MGLAAGTQIGPYEIAELLGAGGMGEVYRAVDTRLGRPVAIKLLVSSGNDRDRVRRFQVETRVVSALQHANILSLYDVGAFQERPFLVSELLQGETLRERMSRSAVAPAEAVDLAIQLCRGLAAAHDKGIVHRDVKPENLFITQEGVLKILDFGIAKRAEDEKKAPDEKPTSGVVERTETGTVLGTAGYMAPEQVRGHAADPRSDIFSLGAVLYEMLAGKRAFQRESEIESGYAILKEDPPALPSSVPPALAKLVRRCLEKTPGDRFQSIRDLAVALDATSGASLSANRPRWPWRLHRFALLMAASLVAFAAIGSGLAWRHSKQASAAPRIMMAVLPFEDFTGDPEKEYFADGLTEGMISQLGRLQPERLGVIARTSVGQYRHTKKSIKEIGNELRVQYVLECSVQRAQDHLRIDAQLIQTSDQTQIWSESYEREIKDVLELQSNVARAIAGQVRLKLGPEQTVGLARARSLNPDAYDAYLRGRYFQQRMTPDAVRQAAAYFQEAIGLDRNYAAAYAALAEATAVQQMNGSARPDEVGPRAKSLTLHALELDDQLAEAHADLAFNLLSHEWNWTGAQIQFQRALDLDPNSADIRRRYAAEFLSSLGHHTEAIAELKRAVESAPLSLAVTTMLGRTYYHARRYDEAIAELTHAATLDASPFPHLWLGLAHAAKGKYSNALHELEKTGDMLAECVAAKGYVLARAGDRAGAEKVLDQLNRRSATGYVPADFIARVYVGLGARDEAFASLEKAYAAHSFWLVFLRVDPTWDSIRDDPRFADLVRRVGIPEPAGGQR